jgi:hypothetical protein
VPRTSTAGLARATAIVQYQLSFGTAFLAAAAAAVSAAVATTAVTTAPTSLDLIFTSFASPRRVVLQVVNDRWERGCSYTGAVGYRMQSRLRR